MGGGSGLGLSDIGPLMGGDTGLAVPVVAVLLCASPAADEADRNNTVTMMRMSCLHFGATSTLPSPFRITKL
jgi:hypothetical protein